MNKIETLNADYALPGSLIQLILLILSGSRFSINIYATAARCGCAGRWLYLE